MHISLRETFEFFNCCFHSCLSSPYMHSAEPCWINTMCRKWSWVTCPHPLLGSGVVRTNKNLSITTYISFQTTNKLRKGAKCVLIWDIVFKIEMAHCHVTCLARFLASSKALPLSTKRWTTFSHLLWTLMRRFLMRTTSCFWLKYFKWVPVLSSWIIRSRWAFTSLAKTFQRKKVIVKFEKYLKM